MKTVSTKKTLLASVFAMLLCVSMFVGSTFAWFTSTATTSVNTIKSGNLKIELQMATAWDSDGKPTAWANADKQTLNFITAEPRDVILWEPGCTYKLPELRVVNKGNLAVKFDYILSGFEGSAKLFDVINWGYVLEDENDDIEAPLKAGETSLYWAITAHMDETAGNEYMDEKIENISITVVATQYAYESDSNGNNYDENATFPVIDAADMKNAIASADDGDIIKLVTDADFSGETIALDKDVVITGENASLQNAYFTVADGKSVSFEKITIADTTTIRAEDDADLTFKDCNFEVTPEKKNGNGRAAAIIGNHQYSNVNLTLQGCTFNYCNSSDDVYNMAVFMWSNVENVLIKDCVFNDYGFVAVKFLEMKAGANIVFEGNTFNMGKRSDANWFWNAAVQIHTVNQPTGNCNVSFINNTFTGDYQTGTESGYKGYEDSSAPIIAELLWNAKDDTALVNTTLTISGNTVNGTAVTEENFAFIKGEGSSVIAK